MKIKKMKKIIQREIDEHGYFGFYSYTDDAYCMMFEVQGIMLISEFIYSKIPELQGTGGIFVACGLKKWIKIRRSSIEEAIRHKGNVYI